MEPGSTEVYGECRWCPSTGVTTNVDPARFSGLEETMGSHGFRFLRERLRHVSPESGTQSLVWTGGPWTRLSCLAKREANVLFQNRTLNFAH